jgi:hypothetical protein
LTPAFLYRADSASYPGYAEAIYNHKQGGSSRTSAFNWWKGEYTNPSADPTRHPTQQPLTYWLKTAGPAWKKIANEANLRLYHYEGGQGVTDIPNITKGFPTTFNATPLTAADAQNFLFDFLNTSTQYADLVTANMQGHADLGVLWPAQYCLAAPQLSSGLWGIYPLTNFVNPPPSTGYLALLAWNRRH